MKNEELIALLDEHIRGIAREVFEEFAAESASSKSTHEAATKLREQLTVINAKEHITVKEAALLLSCSESHIRKLVLLARKGKARRPIPFVDMDGVTVFHRGHLLTWATPSSHLQVVNHEAA